MSINFKNNPFEREEDNDTGFFDHVSDAVLGPVRGGLGAVASIYDLGDWAYTNTAGRFFDEDSSLHSLPDLPHQRDTFLGESTTVTGDIVSGISQFAAGFITVGGPLGQLGKAAGLGKVGTGLLKGAGADFLAFDGQEARLSNLLAEYPALKGPITSFLAADEDDGEIEGRFKNALEGLALGGLTDLLFGVLKPLRRYGKLKAGGASTEEATEQAAKLIDQAGTRKRVLELNQTQVDLLEAVKKSELFGEETLPEMGLTPDYFKKVLEDAVPKTDALKGVAPINPRTDIAERILQDIDAGEINLKQFPAGRTVEFIRAVSGQLEVHMEPYVQAAKEAVPWEVSYKRGVQLWADLNAQPYETAETTLKQLNGFLAADKQSLVHIQAHVSAARLGFEVVGKKIQDIAENIRLGKETSKDLLEGPILLEEFRRLNAYMSGTASETGRLFNLFGSRFDSIQKFEIERALKDLGGSEKVSQTIQDFAAILASDQGGVAGAAKAARDAGMALDMTVEYWMNSILSGATTQAVNFLSNAAVTFYKPFEAMVGGGLGVVTGGGKPATAEFRAGFRQLLGLFQNVREAAHFSKMAFKMNRGVLDPANGKFTAGFKSQYNARGSLLNREGAAQVLTGNPQALDNIIPGPASHAFEGLATLPTRLLTTGDEFFRQLNYRSTLSGELYNEALDKGMGAKQAASYVAKQMDNYFKGGQAATQIDAIKDGIDQATKLGIPKNSEAFNKKVAEVSRSKFAPDNAARALYSSQEATQTLPSSGISNTLNQLTAKHPSLKFIMPFMNVSTNIVKFAGRRFDVLGLGLAKLAQTFPESRVGKYITTFNNKMIQDILSEDPRRSFEAAGRLATGFSAASFFVAMAGNGNISGRGPKNKNHLQILEGTGWKPYSIKIGDKWVSYERLDPFATVLGMAADLVTFGQYTDVEDKDDVALAMNALVASLTNNLTNKTYLSGLADFMNVIEDPDRYGMQFFSNLSAGFLPYSSLTGKVQDSMDPISREATGFFDNIARRVPGFSEDLPPVRNVLGEEVKTAKALGSDVAGNWTNFFVPIQYREVKDDLIFNELAELGHPFSPPSRRMDEYDLRDLTTESGLNAYDRLQQLVGQVSYQGVSIKQALRKLFRSSEYKNLPTEEVTNDDSERVRAVRSVLSRYRRLAREQLLEEVPELKAQEESRALKALLNL